MSPYWAISLVTLAWAGLLLVIAGLVAAVGHRSTRALQYARNVLTQAVSVMIAGPLGALFLRFSVNYFSSQNWNFKRKELSRRELGGGKTLVTYEKGADWGTIFKFLWGGLLAFVALTLFIMAISSINTLVTGRLPKSGDQTKADVNEAPPDTSKSHPRIRDAATADPASRVLVALHATCSVEQEGYCPQCHETRQIASGTFCPVCATALVSLDVVASDKVPVGVGAPLGMLGASAAAPLPPPVVTVRPAVQPSPRAPHRRGKRVVAVLAVAAVIAMIVGLVIWAPWVREAPASPSAIRVASPSATSVLVQWDPSTGGPSVDRYVILRDGAEVGTVPGSETSFMAEGLSPNLVYRFAVVAETGSRRSDPSTEAVVTTLPETPRSVTGTSPDATSVLVQWDAPTNASSVERYVILQAGLELGSVPGSETSFLAQGLTPGIDYRFAVVAVVGERRSDPSTEAVVRVLAPSPEGLTADPATTTIDSVTLTWSPPANAPVPDGYVIIRGGETIANVAQTSFTDTGLAPDTDYQYQVAAAWGDGRSDPTPVLAIRTVTPPVSDARLAGSWPVAITVDKSGGGDLAPGMTWTNTWEFTPNCDAGACDVVITGTISPEGYITHEFSVTLTRDGAEYTGSTTSHITHCGLEPAVVEIQNTLTLRITIETAGASNNAWVAQSLVGTMTLKSSKTSAGGNLYCPAQTVSTLSLRAGEPTSPSQQFALALA